MIAEQLQDLLRSFVKEKAFGGTGALSVAIVVTQHAKALGLPLDPEVLLTKGGGQVYGLGKGSVQSVLKRHGINRVLSSEGGRTSRGSLARMREYVKFLNDLNASGQIALDEIERFWIERVHDFFAGRPFKIKLDSSKGLRTVVRDVIEQAVKRQKERPGMYYAGAVLQHLVGAKLDTALGKGHFTHNGFSTADAPNSRVGDFLVGDVAVHVTTSPGEALIQKCLDNIDNGYRPLIVTLERGLTVAEELAHNVDIADRLDVFEVEQFVALNLYELGKFAVAGRKTAIADMISRYNEIVEQFETDPSLRIELAN